MRGRGRGGSEGCRGVGIYCIVLVYVGRYITIYLPIYLSIYLSVYLY